MIYNYTTYALTPNNGFIIFVGILLAVFVFAVGVTFFSQKDPTATHITPHELGRSILVGFVCGVIFSAVFWQSPYPNEQVTASMVESGDAQYKSGKSSFVKGATVTYKLPDGGLVTFRTDNGTAWYPEIILYKNPTRH